MNNFPILEDLTRAKITINNFHEDTNSNKYLLLCKDISYYTFFETALFHDFDNLAEAVIECSNSIGDIIVVSLSDSGKEIEIWVRDKDNTNMCMFLFDANPMCVSFKG